MRSLVFMIGFVCFLDLSEAIQVNACNGGEKGLDNIQQEITIGRCKKAPCRLRKGTTFPFEYKFTPASDSKSLTNRVWAKIVGVPFPFIGVDGTDACKTIFKEDGKTPAECPLKKGESYIFKNQIDVLSIYPTIKVDVHWGLEGSSGENYVCFEIPARITN